MAKSSSENFKKQFIIKKYEDATILKKKYFDKDLINDKKFQILLLEMGRGKTYAIIEKLIQLNKKYKDKKRLGPI